MSSSRYFQNRLEDYKGVPPEVPRDIIKEQLNHVLDTIIPSGQISHIQQHANDAGVYVGNAGIAYALLNVCESGIYREEQGQYCEANLMQIAMCIIEDSLQQVRMESGSACSILCGAAGILCTAALIYTHAAKLQQTTPNQFERKAKEAKQRFLQLKEQACECACDEVLYGKAGYIIGGMMLGKEMQAEMQPVVVSMLKSGQSFATNLVQQNYKDVPPLFYVWPPGPRASPYFGGAHGLLGIVYALMQHDEATQQYDDVIKQCLSYILSQECDSGGVRAQAGYYPTKMMEEGRKPPLVHWCHGATGAIFVLAKAHQMYGDLVFLEAACRAGEVVWGKGLLKKGPGLCHGISGNGLALLCLHKTTGDPKWLHRVLQFVSFSASDEFLQAADTPDRPHSLFEGWAGICCLFSAILAPQSLGFPFYEITK